MGREKEKQVAEAYCHAAVASGAYQVPSQHCLPLQALCSWAFCTTTSALNLFNTPVHETGPKNLINKPPNLDRVFMCREEKEKQEAEARERERLRNMTEEERAAWERANPKVWSRVWEVWVHVRTCSVNNASLHFCPDTMPLLMRCPGALCCCSELCCVMLLFVPCSDVVWWMVMFRPAQEQQTKEKKKLRFMQKYWHKGEAGAGRGGGAGRGSGAGRERGAGRGRGAGALHTRSLHTHLAQGSAGAAGRRL